MDIDLQETTPTDPWKVKQITVSWALRWLGGTKQNVPAPPEDMVPTKDDFLLPYTDQGSEYKVPGSAFPLDEVICICEVTLGDSSAISPDKTITVPSSKVRIAAGKTYIFTLTPKPAPGKPRRDFIVEEYTPTPT
jgi:hypothetical protein